MKRLTFSCAAAIVLAAAPAVAQNFNEWLGIWDVEMYYQVFLLEDPMTWEIDNATESAAAGIEQASGADIVITWDDASQKYIFASFQITLSEDSFQGYLDDTEDITIRGVRRKSPADEGGPDGPSDDCPVSAVLEDNPQAIKLLQSFRDEFLIPTPAGRMMINLYYNNNKRLYKLVCADAHMRKVCRMFLLSALPLIEQISSHSKH